MTWLSRLLPQGSRLPRISTPKNRTPLSKRHRRMATLERLESRVVLSGSVSTSGFNFSPSGALILRTDAGNNDFEIFEYKSGGATFVQLNAFGTTRIDGNQTTWFSNHPVSSITVIQTNNTVDHDSILLDSDGQAQTVGNVTFTYNRGWLTLDVLGVNNQGAFNLTTHGQLDLTIDSSRFSAITVNQDGCCPAHVTLSNDVAGPVTVREGWGDGSTIDVSNSAFGVTLLAQYNGPQPSMPNCNGNNDSITVTGSTVSQLTVNQPGDGANNSVVIDGLGVAKNGNRPGSFFGVVVNQGDGAGDSASVNNVYISNPQANVPSCAGIAIFQGNGVGDSAVISNSTVPGDVTITQGGLGDPLPPPEEGTPTADSGDFDHASISNVTAGSPRDLLCGAISITQGHGYADYAEIVSSTTWMLDMSITQGDGKCDQAYVVSSAAGLFLLFNPGTDVVVPGSISITQGAAALYPFGAEDCGDTAGVLFSFAAGSITISQNDVANPTGGVAYVYYSTAATGDITISQGERDGDYAYVGYSYAGDDIIITQGNGDGDTAIVTDSEASGDISVSQGDGSGDYALVQYSYADGDINVSQGNGDNDTATVACSVATGDVTITQGNGDYDTANALGVIAGTVDYSYGYPMDVNGLLTITQGDGYANTINVDECLGVNTTVNNAVLTQGNSVPFEGCVPGLSSTINVNDTDITSDLTITQGYTNGVETGAGNYVVNIGTTSAVYVGNNTVINQAGAVNTVILGGAFDESGIDFYTGTLSIWAGSGGVAYVATTNVFVAVPPDDGVNVDAGGEGNVYDDFGNTIGVFVGNFNIGP